MAESDTSRVPGIAPLAEPWEDRPTEELIREAGSLLFDVEQTLKTVGSIVGAINDPVALASFLVSLREVKSVASSVYHDCEQAYAVNASKRAEVPGVGLVEVKTTTNRKEWEHDELFRSVVARLGDEPGIFYDEDGVRLPTVVMAANLVARLRDVMSPSWKVTGLRDLGLDETEFCKVDEEHKSVKLPPKAAA